MPKLDAAPNFYTILDLPPPQPRKTAVLSKEDLKSAYHRALLIHHPDKAPGDVPLADRNVSCSKQGTRYPIDAIKLAYQTLSDPDLRAKYDKEHFQNGHLDQFDQHGNDVKGTHSGVETLDLDDMVYDDRHHRWRKPCRCGNDLGYVVTEAELESESSSGEIYVGCQGCSLYIKVLFADGSDDPDLV